LPAIDICRQFVAQANNVSWQALKLALLIKLCYFG
jgi:hypothetical protein